MYDIQTQLYKFRAADCDTIIWYCKIYTEETFNIRKLNDVEVKE
jgi:hypothetical protein